jgi:hypothetical protein
MLFFTRQTAMLVRSPRLARPLTNFIQTQLLQGHSASPTLPYLYRSSFSTERGKNDYRKDRIRIIEEYKKNTEALNRDLGKTGAYKGSAEPEEVTFSKGDWVGFTATIGGTWLLCDYILVPMTATFIGLDPDSLAGKEMEKKRQTVEKVKERLASWGVFPRK